MVEFVVPTDIPFSSSEDTPQLTINHDVAAELDSSSAFEGPEKLLEVWFAPSAESLPSGVKPDGLKSVAADIWVPMLDEVHCKVLSVLKSERVDAYLLSESSMFVFPHKLILKTCGTTTLLWGLRSLLRIAAVEAGFPVHNTPSVDDERAAATPYRVFYSRKNFLYPEKQPTPHRSWLHEVKFLDETFEGGSAYMVGKMNGDHWYLYITSPETTLTPPRTPDEERTPMKPSRHFRIPTGLASAFNGVPESSDETLEILMTDLDPENAKKFYLEHVSAVASARLSSQAQEARDNSVHSLGDLAGSTATIRTASTAESVVDETFDVSSLGSDSDNHGSYTPVSEQLDPASLTTEGHALGTVVSDNCGLSDVYPTSKYPDAKIDAYMFSPCGFSANGIIPAPQKQENDTVTKAGHYFTVHVTPEPHCSYASFETNVPGGQNGRETSEVIEHVVGIFKPGHFSVTLFEAKAANDVATGAARKRFDSLAGYRRIDRIVHDFDDYELVFRYYEREGWVSGTGVRVGEEI
ncbi:S-adenosylmethionine decarboxylase [Pseudomassariella vexata]|uniref:adenosylmethionine decarboxylase n=1 Tax=Pseudomassariella vexata TaxID=1141098 RepID=A0A1Y2EIL0_9PEZI|nr:S-adenosylmethionine decarboxylase [Pseudomassariella vexata]ORY71403.1 S-adenosylmethionine decarboxylase [Pseudomassariella vexata]